MPPKKIYAKRYEYKFQIPHSIARPITKQTPNKLAALNSFYSRVRDGTIQYFITMESPAYYSYFFRQKISPRGQIAVVNQITYEVRDRNRNILHAGTATTQDTSAAVIAALAATNFLKDPQQYSIDFNADLQDSVHVWHFCRLYKNEF